ncbi:hypothetical protein HPB48_010405 [Haemaphysalis longicornis]|uniref:Uncharacterized protein n=1 Tax=Haemaphysalis longicornis TaxID=44386 RepID=A0A9J6GN17_HAELO|nr:hypothetical protein HPB48_010405 [Haemaphysalis longicornis]
MSCERVTCLKGNGYFSQQGTEKNACDGVGGIVKHQATLHNLREPARNAIQMAEYMVTVLSEKISGVHFIYLESNEVSSYRETKIPSAD